SLVHPNILPIYEVSEYDDGPPFFSMKFASGGSLLDAAPALRNEPRRSVALMAKVARAVQYAHGQGILHRHLKPGNVLLDGRGEPLVSDFGLAKCLEPTSNLTRTLTALARLITWHQSKWIQEAVQQGSSLLHLMFTVWVRFCSI